MSAEHIDFKGIDTEKLAVDAIGFAGHLGCAMMVFCAFLVPCGCLLGLAWRYCVGE